MAYYSKTQKGTKFQTRIVTNVFAINPNQDNPIHLFTAYSPTEAKAFKKSKKLFKEIELGRYPSWIGNDRQDRVHNAVTKGYKIYVKTMAEISDA